jgi:hypothetical protein
MLRKAMLALAILPPSEEGGGPLAVEGERNNDKKTSKSPQKSIFVLTYRYFCFIIYYVYLC